LPSGPCGPRRARFEVRRGMRRSRLYDGSTGRGRHLKHRPQRSRREPGESAPFQKPAAPMPRDRVVSRHRRGPDEWHRFSGWRTSSARDSGRRRFPLT
jgi:hypothetical protein